LQDKRFATPPGPSSCRSRKFARNLVTAAEKNQALAETRPRPTILRRFLSKGWCPRPDSNRHGLPHTPLKRARLPIPPLGLKEQSYRRRRVTAARCSSASGPASVPPAHSSREANPCPDPPSPSRRCRHP